MKLVFATRNRGKVRELGQLLADIENLELLCLDDLPNAVDMREDGATFAENAAIKARAAAKATGLPSLADDSGLEVDALNGRPGIHSARYAGDGASDQQRIAKLLGELEGVPREQRTARFRCAIAYAQPNVDAPPQICEASCEGSITDAPRGSGGFGYDPVFYVPELGKTFAEVSAAQKDRLSHRGKATRQLADLIRAHAATPRVRSEVVGTGAPQR